MKSESVNDLVIDGLRSFNPHPAVPLIDLNNTSNAFIYNCFPVSGTDIFLRLKGEQTKAISLGLNSLKNAKTPVDKDKSVAEDVQYLAPSVK